MGDYERNLLYSTHCNLFYNKSRWMERVVTQLRCEFGRRYEVEIRCLVTNSSRAIKIKATGLSVPRTKSRYSHNPQKISYIKMIELLDKLQDSNYVDLYIGGVVEYDAQGKAKTVEKSFMMFREKFTNLWSDIDVSRADIFAGFDNVQIKDREDRIIKPTRGVTGVREVRNFMTNFNTVISDSYISVAGAVIPSVMYKRVFLDNLDKGGRFYNEGCFQHLDGNERATIRIDDEPVVELDYSSLHASIAYELEGIKLEEGFKPYMIDGDSLVDVNWKEVEAFRNTTGNESYDPRRNLYKFALLCGINCSSLKRTVAAICNEVLTERGRVEKGGLTEKQYRKLKFVGLGKVRYGEVCRAILDHNHRIQDYIFSDSGIRFQAIDSRMAESVIEDFMEINEPALCWHDSFLVKASLEDKLMKSMYDAYKFVLGSNMNCKVEKK